MINVHGGQQSNAKSQVNREVQTSSPQYLCESAHDYNFVTISDQLVQDGHVKINQSNLSQLLLLQQQLSFPDQIRLRNNRPQTQFIMRNSLGIQSQTDKMQQGFDDAMPVPQTQKSYVPYTMQSIDSDQVMINQNNRQLRQNLTRPNTQTSQIQFSIKRQNEGHLQRLSIDQSRSLKTKTNNLKLVDFYDQNSQIMNINEEMESPQVSDSPSRNTNVTHALERRASFHHTKTGQKLECSKNKLKRRECKTREQSRIRINSQNQANAISSIKRNLHNLYLSRVSSTMKQKYFEKQERILSKPNQNWRVRDSNSRQSTKDNLHSKFSQQLLTNQSMQFRTKYPDSILKKMDMTSNQSSKNDSNTKQNIDSLLAKYRAIFPEQKFSTDQFEAPLSNDQLQDDQSVEKILQKLFPLSDEVIKQLCLIYDQKIKSNIDSVSQSLDLNNPYEFAQYGRDELFYQEDKPYLVKQKFIHKIIAISDKFAPNKKYQKNFNEQFQKQLNGFSLLMLKKLLDLIQILQKYQTDEQNLQQQNDIRNEIQTHFRSLSMTKGSFKIFKDNQKQSNASNQFNRRLSVVSQNSVSKKLQQVQNSDVKQSTCKELVYLAFMYKLKMTIDKCMNIDGQKETNFGQLIEHTSKSMEYGLFTNQTALNIIKKTKLQVHQIIGELIPPQNQQFKPLDEIIDKFATKEETLKSSNQPFQNHFRPLTIRNDGTLMLIETQVNENYLQGMKGFIEDLKQMNTNTSQNYRKIVKKVIIEGDNIKEDDLVQILDLCQQSNKHDNQSPQKRQMIQSNFAIKLLTQVRGQLIRNLTLSNVFLSQHFMSYLCESNLIQNLFSLDLINIKLDRKRSFFKELYNYLENEAINLCLMKLRLCSLDLKDELIKNGSVLILIERCYNTLIELDISFCNLYYENAKDFFQSFEALAQEEAEIYTNGVIKGSLRKLNLSHNSFRVQKKLEINYKNCLNSSESSSDDDEEHQHTQSFDQIFLHFIRSGNLKKLTHLDLSGIDSLSSDDLQLILAELTSVDIAPNILSIHLDDHGINEDSILKQDIMDLFQIQPEGVKRDKPSFYDAVKKALRIKKGSKYTQDIIGKFNYNEVISNAINRNPQAKTNHRLLLGMQMQMLQEQKLLLKIGCLQKSHGFARTSHLGSGTDQLTLNRFWNIPEMIVNQNPKLDEDNKTRFFEPDQILKWKIYDNDASTNEHCYICQKQKYTLIFYERGSSSAANQDLYEIKDKQFIDKCYKDYRINYSMDCKQNNNMTTPLIFGTLINQHICTSNTQEKIEKNYRYMNDDVFSRKLRMIRADVFSLLSISMTYQLIDRPEDSDTIKKGVLKFLESENNLRVEKMAIFSKLIGWNKYLHQKCNQNHVLQTQSINEPKCVSNPKAPHEEPNSIHYAFATFLKPGHHQFIIYDPLLNKAFCNEFIQDINIHQLFYPELPIYIPEKIREQKLPQVFVPWIRDTYERQQFAFRKDICPQSNGKELVQRFEPSRYIKNTDDREQCETMLMDYFTVIQNFYIYLLAKSDKYPEIDQYTFIDSIMMIQSIANKTAPDYFEYDPHQLEVSFISATRNDSKNDRALCRCEFLEMLLRLANIRLRNNKDMLFLMQSRISQSLLMKTLTQKKGLNTEPKQILQTTSANVKDNVNSDVQKQDRKSNTQAKEPISSIQDGFSEHYQSSEMTSPQRFKEITEDAPLCNSQVSVGLDNKQKLMKKLKVQVSSRVEQQKLKITQDIKDGSQDASQRLNTDKSDDNKKQSFDLKKQITTKLQTKGKNNPINSLLKDSPDAKRNTISSLIRDSPDLKRNHLNTFSRDSPDIKKPQDNEKMNNEYLFEFIQHGLTPFYETSEIVVMRAAIQDDPLVEKELAKKLKILKDIFKFYRDNRRLFTFDCALKTFELMGKQSDYWLPLSQEDLWPPFVYCMMTVLDEQFNESKYNHILFVEFCEWIARVAFKLYDIVKRRANQDIQFQSQAQSSSSSNQSQENIDQKHIVPSQMSVQLKKLSAPRHQQMEEFLDLFIDRFYTTSGKSKKKVKVKYL